jgi:pyruvate/2-oxoglutarate dehydrogenase complex dihydrolipoamide acyltransferase (E2) component
MTLPNAVKQPWFWVLAGIGAVILLVVVVYFYGKASGRGERATEFDNRQAELLKKSQEADARADKAEAMAEANEVLAEKLKGELLSDRRNAEANAKRIEEEHSRVMAGINKNYEDATNYINSDLTNCERCRDLCARANALAERYGPEFAMARCDGSVKCAEACLSDQAGTP